MKGASGALLKPCGDSIIKICEDAPQQVEWFGLARTIGTVPGVRIPSVALTARRSYDVEYIRGHLATAEPSVTFLERCIGQVKRWANTPAATEKTWNAYVSRLEGHVSIAPTDEMKEAYRLCEEAEPFPSSFCHGDLTLENILIESDGTCVLIDPNFKPGLFQSHILDLGKLLQSTHARYHAVFFSHHAVDLSRHDAWLVEYLKKEDVWKESLLACISHIIRLRKYRPEDQRPLADQILSRLIKEYKQ